MEVQKLFYVYKNTNSITHKVLLLQQLISIVPTTISCHIGYCSNTSILQGISTEVENQA